MVVTVLVTEEEAAVVVEEEAAAARVAEAKSASGRGGGSALAARRWRKRAFAMLGLQRCRPPAHRATWLFGVRLFLPVNWKKNSLITCARDLAREGLCRAACRRSAH